MKYIVWIKERFKVGFEPHEFATATDLANAIINNKLPDGEMVITRRMALSVTEAEEEIVPQRPAWPFDEPIRAAAPVPQPAPAPAEPVRAITEGEPF